MPEVLVHFRTSVKYKCKFLWTGNYQEDTYKEFHYAFLQFPETLSFQLSMVWDIFLFCSESVYCFIVMLFKKMPPVQLLRRRSPITITLEKEWHHQVSINFSFLVWS